MIELAEAINSFLPSGQDDNVPQNEPIFVLTATELRQIIAASIEQATKSILSQLNALQGRITSLEKKYAILEAQEESDIGHLAESIGQDRRRITALEQTRTAPPAPPGEKTAARIEQIKTILKSRGATTFGELERILKISPREMLRITKRLDLRYFEITRRPGDARQKILRLRAIIG